MKYPPQNIAFELSNRCNYSQVHTRCPNDAKAEPIFLKTDIITSLINWFNEEDLSPNIFLNIYNEPLIDPRLFWICEFIYKHTDCRIEIFTNGWNLNQYIFDELMKWNVFFTVSVYSDSEEERLRKIKGLTDYYPQKIQRIILDPQVMQIYNNPPIYQGPCLFPSTYPMINHLGHLSLCCRDYEWRESFGDLNNMVMEDAFFSEKRLKICDELAKGIRTLDVCKRCHHVGWGITQEEWDKWKKQNPSS